MLAEEEEENWSSFFWWWFPLKLSTFLLPLQDSRYLKKLANCHFDSLFSYRFLLIYATFFFLFSSLLLVHVSLLSVFCLSYTLLLSFLFSASHLYFPFSPFLSLSLPKLTWFLFSSSLFYSNIEKFSGNLVIVNEILVNSNRVFRDNFLPFWDYKGIFAWIDQSLSHPKAHFEFVRWPYLRISMLQDCMGWKKNYLSTSGLPCFGHR